MDFEDARTYLINVLKANAYRMLRASVCHNGLPFFLFLLFFGQVQQVRAILIVSYVVEK